MNNNCSNKNIMVVKVINNGAINSHAEIDIVEEAIEVDAELVDNKGGCNGNLASMWQDCNKWGKKSLRPPLKLGQKSIRPPLNSLPKMVRPPS